MSAFIQQAVAALRWVETLEQTETAQIISFALHQVIANERTPFIRNRDHFVIGPRRFKVLDGLDYYRTILLNRKSEVWYPDSAESEIDIFAVYSASQVEPPQPSGYNKGDPRETVWADIDSELLPESTRIGPSICGTLQAQIDHEVRRSLYWYIESLLASQTDEALKRLNELEAHMRAYSPSHRKRKLKGNAPAPGDIHAVAREFVKIAFNKGRPRPLNGPKQQVADLVRQSCNYALKVLRKNDATKVIADHLDEFVKIGRICEYRGDWKWRF